MKPIRAWHVIAFSLLLPLCSCNLFSHPFAFNNPHDPQNAWVYTGNVGKMYMSDGSGIPTISDIAVTPDGSSFIAASTYQNGIWEIPTGSGSATFYSDSDNVAFQNLCIDNSGSNVYLVQGDGRHIYKFDLATHDFTQIYAMADSANGNFLDIAIDSSGTLYVPNLSMAQVLIQSMSTSGTILGTLPSSSYLASAGNVQSIAVSDSYIYVAVSNYNCVLIFDKSSGAPYGEIYWDGAIWHNDSWSGGVPTMGINQAEYLVYNNGQSRLYASFWDGKPIDVLDPASPTPYQSSYGTASDYTNTWNARIAVDNSGKMYASDAQLGFIKEYPSNTTVYVNRTREPGEFLNIRDVHLGASGTMYFVDGSLWQITSLTSDGQFHLFGTPGTGTGQLSWPQTITEKNGEVYCGDGGSMVLHYNSSGTYIDEGDVWTQGNPMRMATMADGRILIWAAKQPAPGSAFFTYTTSPWTLAGGPFTPDPRFTTATDVHLCLAADGKMYCTFFDTTQASFGYLADDLSTYTEIWNSSSQAALFTPAALSVANNIYGTTGIGQAPAGDLWVGFRSLSAMVRFTTTGGVFASFSTNTGYQGKQWNPGKIVAYSLDASSNWNGISAPRLMCVDANQNIFVTYDQFDPPLLEFSPTVSLK